ncbi:MAG: hypothetical protein GY854_08540 [Deltaproteobacteria bacterium]|nr:hypothetical protein [Deltaproteobacteria bacterium]
MRWLGFVISFLLVLGVVSCDDDDDDDDDNGGSCESICKAEAAQNCTIINDCDTFCSSAKKLAPKSDCEDEYDNWLSCAQNSGVCEDDCDNEANFWSNCAAIYCAMHLDDSDCVDHLGSL